MNYMTLFLPCEEEASIDYIETLFFMDNICLDAAENAMNAGNAGFSRFAELLRLLIESVKNYQESSCKSQRQPTICLVDR
jgi:hypothetical protein